MSSGLDLREYRGSEIAGCLDAVAELRMTVFRDWPYLYDGDVEYEKRYLDAYAKSPRSFALVVYDGERPVGATTRCGRPTTARSIPSGAASATSRGRNWWRISPGATSATSRRRRNR